MNGDESETSFQKIKADLRHFARREDCDVTPMFVGRMLLLTPGFQFVLSRRIQEMLHKIPVVGRLLRRIAWWLSCLVFSSELAMAATIGGGFYVPHPFGIVVGAARIGRNVMLRQNVTIGHKDPVLKGEPTIEDNVSLSAGCVILGDLTIGEGAVVGANAVVTKDVPPGYVALGVPARSMPPRVTA